MPRTLSHADALKRAGLPTMRTLEARILRTFDRATSADLEAGARWYGEAADVACSLAVRGRTRAQAAAVIAHLSPRTSWSRNIAGAAAMMHADPGDWVDAARAAGMIEDNALRARVALASSGNPIYTFGDKAHKTRSFYLNIMGDVEAVTVDVWALRVVGIEDDSVIKRVGVYAAIAEAYRRAARRAGIDPSTMQATTWVVARNGRAS